MYNKITYKDMLKIKEEIEYRKLVVRKQALEEVKEARAHGDLSENFEYKAAKQFKNQNESRIRYLERMLKTAIIIPEDSDEDEVGINDRVTLYYPADDEEETIKVVSTIRSNSLKGRISIDSPLGKAIMHHKVGDKITVTANDNSTYEVVIKKIEKFSNEEDDEDNKINTY